MSSVPAMESQSRTSDPQAVKTRRPSGLNRASRQDDVLSFEDTPTRSRNLSAAVVLPVDDLRFGAAGDHNSRTIRVE